MVVLPPVLHDIYDYLTPLTPAQQLDLDRSQRRLLYKLRHAIGGWKIHTIDPSETGRSGLQLRRLLPLLCGLRPAGHSRGAELRFSHQQPISAAVACHRSCGHLG